MHDSEITREESWSQNASRTQGRLGRRSGCLKEEGRHWQGALGKLQMIKEEMGFRSTRIYQVKKCLLGGVTVMSKVSVFMSSKISKHYKPGT